MKIATDRLTLRPLESTDFESLCQLEQNPLVMQYLANGPQSKSEVKKHMQMLITHHEMHGFSWGALIEKETNAFIGLAGLAYMFFDPANSLVELAYILGSSSWHKGYATEIAQACITYGFVELKRQKLIAVTRIHNVSSKRVLQKLGFCYIRDICYRGKAVSYYEIFNPISHTALYSARQTL